MSNSIVRKEQLVAERTNRFIDMLYITHALKTGKIEKAFRSVPRHLFVDQYYDEGKGKRSRPIKVDPKRPTATQLKKIYSDVALVSHRNPPSSTSQSSLVADMLEKLKLKAGMKVLEIGAGSGYQTAILAELALEVFSVERLPELARMVSTRLETLGYGHVRIRYANGSLGWPEHAPYDGMIVTAAVPRLPEGLGEQLAEGGRLILPVGQQQAQVLLHVEKSHGKLKIQEITNCVFGCYWKSAID